MKSLPWKILFGPTKLKHFFTIKKGVDASIINSKSNYIIMGLDMYLSKQTYVKNWNHQEPEERHEISITKNGKMTNIKTERVSAIVEDIAYWRKANQIHNWFVENCQEGVDNCASHIVTFEKLHELLQTCINVRNSLKREGTHDIQVKSSDGTKMITVTVFKDTTIAERLLPTTGGFFFGDTQYDTYYLEDVEATLKALEGIVNENEADYADYYYRASW